MLPGVQVFDGGYLWGRIITNGNFCQNKQAYSTLNIEQEAPNHGLNADKETRFFRVYPNPTSGKFNIVLTDNEYINPISVEIFGILGEKVLSCELPAVKQYEIDLTGKPSGLYLLRVVMAGRMEFEKILLR
jgi:hypothetical protein